MRTHGRRVLVAMASLAAAPQLARATPCAITIDAPPDASEAILSWVAGERDCIALEVRVTRIEAGYLTVGRSRDGRSFERIVPDLETLGALVATWATARSDVSRAAEVIAPNERLPELLGVPALPATAPRSIDATGTARPSRGDDVHARVGIRVAIDLVTLDRWNAGITVGASTEPVKLFSSSDIDGATAATANEPHLVTLANVSRRFGSEQTVLVRVSAGIGVRFAQLRDIDRKVGTRASMVPRPYVATPIGDLSLTVARSLRPGLSIVAGAVATFATSSSDALVSSTDYHFAPAHGNDLELAWIAGLAFGC